MNANGKKRSQRVQQGLLVSCAWMASGSGDAQAVSAHDQPAKNWEVGAVLDVAHTSRFLALGQRDQGLGLGHSDVFGRGPIGRIFDAQIGLAAHSQEGKLELELEEAWLQTQTLPAGLQARAGRFSSQIGYLNE